MRIRYEGLEYEVHAIHESPDGLAYFIEVPDYGFWFVNDRNIKVIDVSVPCDWTAETYPSYLNGFTIIGPPCMTKSIEAFESCVEYDHDYIESYNGSKEYDYTCIEALREFARNEEKRKLQTFFSECFPEDWPQRGLEWSEIVEKYCHNVPSKGYLSSMLDALKHFCVEYYYRDEREIEEKLLLEYGCFYWPSEEGRFVKPWLDQLVRMFEENIR
jgi:hypothetical protein